MCVSDEDPSNQLFGSSITYRIALGQQQGREVFTPLYHQAGSIHEAPVNDPQRQGALRISPKVGALGERLGVKNPKAPNTFQQFLKFGSDQIWVAKTLLTTHSLINDKYLKDHIDCERALLLSIELTKNIAEMHELAQRFEAEQRAAVEGLDSEIRKDGSFMLPAVGNTEIRCIEFVQKSDHAIARLFKIVKLFYLETGKGGWDKFAAKIEDEGEGIDTFPGFLRRALPLLHLVRNARNCIEHPRVEQKMIATNFAINEKNALTSPTVEFVCPGVGLDQTPAVEFMHSLNQEMLEIVELMVVHLCARHTKSSPTFPIQISEVPSGRRHYEHVKFGYGLFHGDEFIPIS